MDDGSESASDAGSCAGSYDASDDEETEKSFDDDSSNDDSDKGGGRAPATSPSGRRLWTTEEEDERVFGHVAEHGPGGWGPLAEELGRTTRSVGGRYIRLLKLYPERQPDFGRSHWSTADDVTMKKHVDRYGAGNWAALASSLGKSRHSVVCHYQSLMRSGVTMAQGAPGRRGPWTQEEDDLLVSYVHEHGCSHWAELDERLQRCDGAARKRKLLKERGAVVANVGVAVRGRARRMLN
jgi:hypothetical protein